MTPRSSATSGRSGNCSRSAASSAAPGVALQAAAARIGRACRDRPVRRQRAEMIEPQQVQALQLRRDALRPPAEILAPERRPVIQRVAPRLAFLGEIVRRHPADRRRLAPGAQLKQLAAASTPPPTTARRRTAGRRRAGCRVPGRSARSALHCRWKAYCSNSHCRSCAASCCARLRQRVRGTLAQRLRPAPERRVVEGARQRLKERVVGQPRLRWRQESAASTGACAGGSSPGRGAPGCPRSPSAPSRASRPRRWVPAAAPATR